MKTQPNINRKFCLQMAAAITVITVLLAYKGGAGVWPALSVAATFALVGLIRAQLANGFRKGWLRLGEVLGNINGMVLLSVIYFLVITPLGIIRRFLGRDAMGQQFKTPASSYWQQPDDTQSSMEQQF